MNLAFDTHAAVKRLRQAGFTEGQAEALSETLQDGVTGGDLATKADLAEVKDELKAELADLRSGVETRFARLEVDLVWLKRLGALIAALLAVPLLRELLAALP